MVPQINIDISNQDFYNLNSNPDRFDDSDSDNMLQLPTSEYQSTDDINNILESKSNSHLFLLHSNIRSLPKNIELLKENLTSLSVNPDIIAITETKLNSNSIDNTDIENYDFYHNDSPTAAGGTALYVKRHFRAICRHDIYIEMPEVESTWIQVERQKSSPLIIGCIYRHPNANLEDFTNKLELLLKQFNDQKLETYILYN